jgi:nicotinamidase-related amidase
MAGMTQTALLVIDMEEDFVRGPMAVPGAEPMAERLAPLVAAAREGGALIVFVTQALRPTGADVGPLARFDDVREGRVLREGTEGVRVVAELGPQPTDCFVTKRRFGAFLGTDLDLLLRSRHVTRVFVCGISAHVCCDTTVREAFQLGYDSVYIVDGVTMGDLPDLGWGPISADDAQRVVATTIAHRFGAVATIADVLTELAG